MNKFKIGDRVKVVKTGEIGTIRSIDDDDIDKYGSSNLSYKIYTNDFSHYYAVHDIELVQEILTEEEKEYLSFVIKPFKDKIISITKHKPAIEPLECIEFKNKYEIFFYLPEFEEGKYYKNMETNKDYTLEDLGL